MFSLDWGKLIPDKDLANVAAEIEYFTALFPPFLLGGNKDSASLELLTFLPLLISTIARAISAESLYFRFGRLLTKFSNSFLLLVYVENL